MSLTIGGLLWNYAKSPSSRANAFRSRAHFQTTWCARARPHDRGTEEPRRGLQTLWPVIGEVVLGAVIKHSSDWNFARECALGSGLSAYTPAYDLSQACGTSLQATFAVANKIRLGQIEAGIAGGVDTNSDIPVTFSRKFAQIMLAASREKSFMGRMGVFSKLKIADLKPQTPGVVEPRTGLSMGESCEAMIKEWESHARPGRIGVDEPNERG